MSDQARRGRRKAGRGAGAVERKVRWLHGGQDSLTVHDLDGLDRQIIEHLQGNGRLSNAAIARALGVTEATVRHRIERLISNGFIRVTAVINPRKTAYQVDVIMWMRLERGKARASAERIAQFPNVVYVGLTTGRYDLLVEALFESDEELFEFLTSKLSRSLGVIQSETYHVLRTVKINYDWKVPLNHPRREARAATAPGGNAMLAARRRAARQSRPRGWEPGANRDGRGVPAGRKWRTRIQTGRGDDRR